MLAVVTKHAQSACSTLPELLGQMSFWENDPLLRTSPKQSRKEKGMGTLTETKHESLLRKYC